MDDDELPICPACNGSGEGMYSGGNCRKCGGTGVAYPDECEECGQKKCVCNIIDGYED